jgi:hypothetical protein
MTYPLGWETRAFKCGGCKLKHRMTVHAERANDPRVMDRFRLLAAVGTWVIDLDGQAWCPEHKGGAAC